MIQIAHKPAAMVKAVMPVDRAVTAETRLKPIGMPAPEDSEELHFKPFGIKLGVVPSPDNGESEHVVGSFITNSGEVAALAA